MGTELFEREKDMALNVHATLSLAKIDNALKAMEEGTYGKCEVCGKIFHLNVLEAVPYTTVCMEHATDTGNSRDRPVEEDILNPPHKNSFSKDQDGNIHDYQDSFQGSRKSGTSETPSDFIGDHDDYDTLYDNGMEMGQLKNTKIYCYEYRWTGARVIESQESEEYKVELDDKGMESPRRYSLP